MSDMSLIMKDLVLQHTISYRDCLRAVLRFGRVKVQSLVTGGEKDF